MKFPFNLFLTGACVTSKIFGQAAHAGGPDCIVDYNTVPYRTIHTSISSEYGTIHHELGNGSSSSVYLLDRHSDHAQLAIKIFKPISANSTRHEELSNYIKLEYYIGSQLDGHPGIAEHIELLYEEPTSTWAIALAYHPKTLQDVLREKNATKSDIAAIFLEISKTMAYVHSKGISHGDLKTRNILMSDSNMPQLIDWGGATFAGCQVDTPHAISRPANVIPGNAGTPAYLPPEVWTVLEYDRLKADVWSLGILFHFMMLGRFPWYSASVEDDRFVQFTGLGTRTMQLEYPQCAASGMRLRRGLPGGFATMLADLLVLDPRSRPSIGALLETSRSAG